MKFPRVLAESEDFFAGLQLPDHRFKSDLRLLKENAAGSSVRDGPAVFPFLSAGQRGLLLREIYFCLRS